MNGDDQEREMVNWWRNNYEDGYAARMPASGGRTNDELPDVLGVKGWLSYAVELKSTSKDYARFTTEEAMELVKFAQRWGAIPLFVGRFTYDTNFYCIRVGDIPKLTEIEADSFAISRSDRTRYTTLEKVLEANDRQVTPDLTIGELEGFINQQSFATV